MVRKVRWVWISTPRYTVQCDLDDYGCISRTAPICRWMKDQHIDTIKYKLGNQATIKIFEDEMVDTEKQLSDDEYREKLFKAYDKMSKEILELRGIIQNKMKYTIENKEAWVRKVTKAGDDMRKLNSATLHYIEDNIQ